MTTPTHGTLWVRYLGSKAILCADKFLLPTDQVPEMVKRLRSRGDVAQIWYMAGTEFVREHAHEHK